MTKFPFYKQPDSMDCGPTCLRIMHNLSQFFQGRTVVVVAHRLSTVKNADQIIVLEKGKIIETGNHQSLIAQKGSYFELVKNQLELGD